jgi:two-component system, NarL family, nitrate/nitrite response regulator NarL
VVRVAGRAYCRHMSLLRHEHGTPLDTLSPRENEVLRRTSLGETNAEIAVALGITIHAVKFHLASVFRKLGVPNRTMAASIYLMATADRGTRS